MFKKLVLVLVLGIVFSVAASAQITDVYWTTYFSNNGVVLDGDAPTNGIPITFGNGNDSSIYIINPGVQGAPIDPTTGLFSATGYLCANIYVFDKGQEMAECCSCPISPNGILSLSVGANLTLNPLTGVPLTGGVIKLVSSQPVSVAGAGNSLTSVTAACDPGEIGFNILGLDGPSSLGSVEPIVPDLSAWGTHIQNFAGGQVLTEARFQAEPLSTAEAAFLPVACQMNHYLGSGRGVCTCNATIAVAP